LNSSPMWSVESDQVNAHMGISVGSAGDVNGDAYHDVFVGANSFDNDQVDEGKVFVYYGSAGGLPSTPNWTAEGGQTSANFGLVVSGVGDVNGDNKADIVIGACLYDHGQQDEGGIFVYYGSATGLKIDPAWTSGSSDSSAAAPDWTAEGNQASSGFGCTVAGAGDVNGDGKADIIVGAPNYDNGQDNEGRVLIYYGSASQ
jgi:hypothetical protein